MRPGQLPVDYVVQAVLAILGAVGLLALVLSGFLVVNTISAVLTQQTTQIGVMKAFGARNGQLVPMYLGMVLLYGLAGPASCPTAGHGERILLDQADRRLPEL